MRTGISITLTPSDRQRLEAVASNRNTAQKHVWRAVIVLLSADGIGTTEIMCRIAALLPPAYRGVYAEHPRLKELLMASPTAPSPDR